MTNKQKPNRPEEQRLSQMMTHLVGLCSRDALTLGELLHELSLFGHMLVCLVFAVPFLMPVPLPGLSTAFGFVIGFVALQIVLNKDPWVPNAWRNKSISTALLRKLFAALARLLLVTERFIRPRLNLFARHPGLVRANGALIFLISMLLAIPMPPGFNAPPALAIVVLTIGSLERDGLVVILGYVLSILNFLLFAIFFTLGFDGIKMLLQNMNR